MGGKNHQPCNQYLLNSTRLSKHLSLAYAHLELGNVALEDILIGELLPGRNSTTAISHYDKINVEMTASIEELDQARKALINLRQQMDVVGFVDLPTLKTIDLTGIGVNLDANGLINLSTWQRIHSIMSSGGFYKVIDLFETEINELVVLSRQLRDNSFQGNLKHQVAEGILSKVVEENTMDNFKPEFAALYTKWTKFNGLFLASSLMSTELWYAWMAKGSLAPTVRQLKVA